MVGPVLLLVRGSHKRMTRSGDPDAIVRPKGSAARAYTEDLGADASGGFKVTRASVVG
jgi:hypothetical protein